MFQHNVHFTYEIIYNTPPPPPPPTMKEYTHILQVQTNSQVDLDIVNAIRHRISREFEKSRHETIDNMDLVFKWSRSDISNQIYY